MRHLLMMILLLTGCASFGDARAEREAQLTGFIGQSEADLVRTLGVPSRQFEADGHRFLAYVDRRVELVPGSMLWRPYRYGFGYGPVFPPQAIEQSCETTFEVVGGKVTSFALRGRGC